MLMPTGNDNVWMIKVRDSGKLYKIDVLDLLQKAGIKTDAWGQELPLTKGEVSVDTTKGRIEQTIVPKTPTKPKIKKLKEEKKDETE